MTSCGLNGGPLTATGRYEARIACDLWSAQGTGRYDVSLARLKYAKHPFITQDKRDGETTAVQYIANMRDGAVAGYKYFDIRPAKTLSVEVSGRGDGAFRVYCDEECRQLVSEIPIHIRSRKSGEYTARIETEKLTVDVLPLYFKYVGTGKIDFYGFTFR